MSTLECDFTAMALLEMEMFPGTCMVAVPLRTPIFLGAEVLPVHASERDLRPRVDVVQDP